MRRRPLPWSGPPPALLLGLVGLAGIGPTAQEASSEASAPELRIEGLPASATLHVGESLALSPRVVDAAGAVVERDLIFYTTSRRALEVDDQGNVTARRPGDHVVVVRSLGPREERLAAKVAVHVPYPPLARIELVSESGDPLEALRLFDGTSPRVHARAVDAAGLVRENALVTLRVEPEGFAAVDRHGVLTTQAPGAFELVARVEGGDGEAPLETRVHGEVVANPVARVELEAGATEARTGDVVAFRARCLDPAGMEVPSAPVRFSVASRPDDDLAPPATAQVEPDGRFVAGRPGYYTVSAACGRVAAERTIRVEPRNVQGRIELVGRGKVDDVHTSDLWVWEGVDGRDYAVTGTWGGNGEAHFWDVTDPTDIQRIHTVTVDARTVNDVKVSADGRLCVISREGASNRRNGIVLIDVTNPREASVVSTFDDELTGGVHNLFIWEGHVLALSAGRRYDIIDVRDTAHPRRVSTFELDTPDHSIHDVWVVDGIAYSSNWDDGVVLVDVGNGVAGGSLEHPVRIGSYAYPSGWNHAAFPYDDPQTGKKWVIAGDEAFPYGLNLTDHPTYPRGWLHFIDFTDPKHPQEVARYQVPEAGTHNFWVEDELLYVAYYNGGVRVVDLSGDLLGDLYQQGREVGWFLPTDPEGVIPNAPMVWGPQPHKGTIFFSDWNTGLWAVKLERESVQ